MCEKNVAVVYTSRNGSTQRYAEWIAEACSADLFPLENAVIDDLVEYGTVVFGGCVYNGIIDGISFLKNNESLLERTRLIVFTVGLTQPGDEAAFQQVLRRNFAPEEQNRFHIYHFLGALDYRKMKLLQRLMMRLLKKSIQKKPPELRSRLETYLLDSYGGKADFTDRTYIRPLVEEVLSEPAAEG